MSQETQQHIIEAAKQIFARSGYDGLSMRKLATEAGISLSVIYHYYADKDVLLKEIFDATNTQLGRDRALLSERDSMIDALRDRVDFQLTHMADVVFVLKYYLHYRDTFEKNKYGYVPPKTSLHIEEVLQLGKKTGELRDGIDIKREAKVITHAINGYLLEIYPATPSTAEHKRLVRDITTFVARSITREFAEAPMK